MRHRFLTLLLCWAWCLAAVQPVCGQIQLNGAAVGLEPGCVGFQPAGEFTAGSFWETRAIDLRDSFDMTFQVFLGCDDGPADEGLVFAFQAVGASLGSYRRNLGFEGLDYTLGVELDLWRDAGDNDPATDHLAIIRDGDLQHGGPNTLAGPLAAGSGDVQDCQWHELRIVWRPGERRLTVFFDCEQRLQYSGNIADEIFRGEQKVLWGFTAGTRGAASALRICSDHGRPLGLLADVALCRGGSVRLQAPVAGQFYRWSPAEGLDNPNIAAPLASPRQTTTYRVTIGEACGRRRYDEVTVAVIDPGWAVDLGPPDTALCRGMTLTLDATAENAAYRWSTGAQTARLTVDQPGVYRVTVTTPVCTLTDEITVRQIDPPSFAFGADTVVCRDEPLVLAVTGEAAYVRWADGPAESPRRISRPGVYRVQAGNACGTAEAVIEVVEQPCRALYLPTAFSPNGDGVNDHFRLFGRDQAAGRIRSMRIFDRWGNLVFAAADVAPDDPAAAWDGTVRGRPAPAGTYVAVVEWEGAAGKRTVEAGEVQLLR